MRQNELKSVGIVGCGWLGKALATSLIDQNYSVVVTTQSKDKQEQLRGLKLNVEQVVLPVDHNDEKSLAVEKNVFKQNCIVIAIPPQLKKGKLDYPDKIKQIINAAQINDVKRIIMISSTAVYNGLSGEVNEASSLEYTAPKVDVIAKAEQLVLNANCEGIVLRLAGLLGPDRHPGSFLQRNPNLANSTMPVNMIHQFDVVGLIKALIVKENVSGIFNGVSGTHVSKNNFYYCAAQSMNLPVPEKLPANMMSNDKVIVGDKAQKELGYIFKYNDLIQWLKTESIAN